MLFLFCHIPAMMAQNRLQLLEIAFEQQSDCLFNQFSDFWKYKGLQDIARNRRETIRQTPAKFSQNFKAEHQKDLLDIVSQSLFEYIYLTTNRSASYIVIPNKIAVMTNVEKTPSSLRYSATENIHIFSPQDLNIIEIWQKATLNNRASIILGDTLLVNTLGDFVKKSTSDSIKQKKIAFLQQKIPIHQLTSSKIYRNYLADEHFYENIYGNNDLFLPYNLPFIASIEINDKWNKAYINLNDTNLKPYFISFIKKKGKWRRSAIY